MTNVKAPAQLEQGLSIDLMRACFRYDGETGKLFWKVSPGGRLGAKAGDEAGTNISSTGYNRVGIFGKVFQVHRIIMAITYGYWPPEVVDHINGDRLDNRLTNLRYASISQNGANRGPDKLGKHSSEYKGVCFFDGTWRASVAGRYLGSFNSEEAAAKVYDAVARDVWGEFARVNFPSFEEQ